MTCESICNKVKLGTANTVTRWGKATRTRQKVNEEIRT